MKDCQFRFAQLRAALAETDLRQARTSTCHNRECAWADFKIERAFVTSRNLVEFLRTIGDDAGEDIKTTGRAFWIGGC